LLVALLSSLEPAAGGASCPRAFLKVAGRSVIERQAELALELGCERVICFSQGLPPELVAAQHLVEHSGRRFHVVRSADALHALMHAPDEIVVLADGMLPDLGLLRETIGEQRGVVAFPAEQGLAAGFERLDRDLAWAGVFRCGGGEVERLTDLPGDIDPLSALMRASLQAGRPVRALSANVLVEGRWPLLTTAQQAREEGKRSVERRFTPATWSAPVNAMVDRAVRRNADAILSRDGNGTFAGIGAAVALFSGIVAMSIDYLAGGLGLLAMGAAALRARRGIRLLGRSDRAAQGSLPEIAPDAALLAGLVSLGGADFWPQVYFPVLVTLGLLHIAALHGPPWLKALAEDRAAFLLVLAIAAAQGGLGLAFHGIALAVLGTLVFAPYLVRLTRA
jgi:hypothetical protein